MPRRKTPKTTIKDRASRVTIIDVAKRAGVRSPLVDVGFTKADIRAAAAAIGMDTWDKPAAACLSSRIPCLSHSSAQRMNTAGSAKPKSRPPNSRCFTGR